MVTSSSIPYSAAKMSDIEMSPDEAFEEVLEDLDYEPIVKTRVSNSEDTSIEEIDTTVTGIDSLSLLPLIFLSTLGPSPAYN